MAAAAAAAVGSAVMVPAVRAATYTYTPTEATNTSAAPDNWSAGPAAGWDTTPVSASDTTLVLNGPTTAVTRFTNNDVANPFQLNVLTLQGTSASTTTGALTVQGNALNFVANGATAPTVNLSASKGTATTYTFTVNNPVTLSADTTFQGAGTASAFTFAGAIGGSGALNKTGASLLQLSASGNNYTGATTVSGGTLQLGAANVIPDTSPVTVNGGVFNFNTKAETIASLALSSGGLINNTATTINITGAMTNSSTTTGGSGAALVVNSGGKITVGGLATFNAGATTLIGASNPSSLVLNGGANITGASIKINAGAATSKVVLGGDVTTNASSAVSQITYGTTTAALNNQLDLNGANRTFNVAHNTGNAADLLITLQVTSGTGTGSLTKTGSGIMALAGTTAGSNSTSANSYTGGTVISAGTLAAQVNSAFGTGNVTVSPGAILDLSSSFVTSGAVADNATLTLSSSGPTFAQVAFGTSTLNEAVGQLIVNGVNEVPGAYTASNLPSFITGSGTLTVTPEPTSAALAALATPGLLARRRRRSR